MPPAGRLAATRSCLPRHLKLQLLKRALPNPSTHAAAKIDSPSIEEAIAFVTSAAAGAWLGGSSRLHTAHVPHGA